MYDLTIGAVVAGKGIRRVVILQLRQLSQRSRSGSKKFSHLCNICYVSTC
jgi:hypothetical protein